MEERRLLSASAGPAFADFVQVEVIGRHIFYENSKFDGNTVGPSPIDAAAIASDKLALLPGQTASFQNYTSYSRGINGVMVDIAGLPDSLSLADFQFASATGPGATTWNLVESPTMSVSRGAGFNGASRFTFTWVGNNAVRNGWLQVSVLSTVRTGLKAADVFYFGNAVGETGNSSDSRVNATDEILARSNPATFLQPAALTNRYDFNRDGLVDATDQILTRSNSTSVATALPLLSIAPVPPLVNAPDPDGFNPVNDGYYSEYAPTIVKSTSGTLLMFLEGRTSIADASARDIVMRRSFDNGVTWSAIQVIYHETQNVQAGSVAPVVDEITGTILVLFTRARTWQYVMRSNDDGASWTTPEDITAGVKYVNPSTPGGVDYGTNYGGFSIYDTGPGHGIQLKNGPYAGRLIITAQHRFEGLPTGYSLSNIIYSDDHGLTWHLGGGMNYIDYPELYTNESSIVELANGDLYLNMRIQGGLQENGQNYRGSAISQDGGMTWSTRLKKELALTVPTTQASLLRINDNVIAFAAPDNPTVNDVTGRQQMTIWLSYDEAQTWVKSHVVFYSYAGYLDMVLVGPDTILLAFNSGLDEGPNAWHQRVSLARINLDWLESSQPRAFEWNFSEQAPGTVVVPGPPSLRDDGQWDLRAEIQGAGGSQSSYVAGQYGGSALDLTENSDRVLLTPAKVRALQLGEQDSLTVAIDFRTSDRDGMLVGSLPADQEGWSIQIVDGKVRFSVTDQAITSFIDSDITIDDDQWHHVEVTRDRDDGVLRLSIDGHESTPVIDQSADILAAGAVYLGSDRNGGSQLAVVVDRLRIEISS